MSPQIIIIAAGKGKRMHSSLPKVLHPVLFRPMIHYVLELAKALEARSIHMVVAPDDSQVKEECRSFEGVHYVVQETPKGTADAVSAVESHLTGKEGPVIVLSGDVILLKTDTVRSLIDKWEKKKAAGALVSAVLQNPFGYGRIVREKGGVYIREEADCTEEERKIQEVNAGVYCFDKDSLFSALKKVENRNRQKEFYLTDVVGVLSQDKKNISIFQLDDAGEMTGINDRAALSQVEAVLQERINHTWMLSGVSIQSPSSVFIDSKSRIEKDVSIEQGCTIISSVIERDVVIESGSRIVNCVVGAGTKIKQGSYLSDSQVGPDCYVGPYAHLRPGTRLDKDVKIGNYVEVKKSHLREGTKAAHLSYIGDAEIGKSVNLGCGFITCNYDGSPQKHKTVIGDRVFVGSDSQTVAPVTIGDGAYVASGTTVTEDVPPNALALSRGKQVVKTEWRTAKKRRD